MAEGKSIWTGLARGLGRHCPNCGKGRLFSGYLKVRSPCDVCGEANGKYPSDDFPPYLTMFIVGHIIIGAVLYVDDVYEPPMWLEAVIWLPLTVILCLALLPLMKGAVVGLCWATGVVRQETPT